MKKVFSVIIAVALLCTLSACSLRSITESVMSTPAPTETMPEPTAELTPEPTPEPTSEPTPEPVSSPYKAILDRYYLALSENWGPGAMSENGINYMLSMYGGSDPCAAVGYCITDLDGDGLDELIIGNIGDDEFVTNMIYDLYTLVDGEPVLSLSATERNRYYMCDNGFFINEGSSSAAHSETIYYKLVDSIFVFEEAVVFDSEMDPDANWFYTVDYNMSRERFKSVTSQEAIDFMDERESHVTRPAYIPFADYPNHNW